VRCFVIIIFVFFSIGCQIPWVNHCSEDERIVNQITNSAAKKIKRETGLVPFGFGGQMMDQIKVLTLVFLYRQPVDIDKARELLVTASEILLHEINSDERVRPYLVCYPFEPKNIVIQLVIQKEDGHSFGGENLSVITTRRGIIEYEIDDSVIPLLKTIYEETYQEALQKVANAKELSKINCSLPQTIQFLSHVRYAIKSDRH
jgi:hypothetical protein